MYRLLVVDDDIELQQNLAEVLVSAGFDVEVAQRAEEAIELLERADFHLVLLDLIMPGMGGMDALPVIKKRFPKVRIIMITAFATVDNAVEAMRKGADDYIAKPFRVNDLLVAIKKCIEQIKFRECRAVLDIDATFNCMANTIRREILFLVGQEGKIRFMDIARTLEIEDHTKVNFHLKVLKDSNLIEQDGRKFYLLTPEGKKVSECLSMVMKNLSK